MKIRKNLRLSSFMRAELINPYQCQLNQSPWDVIHFSEETETTLHQNERGIHRCTEEDGGFGNFNGDIGGSVTSLKEKDLENEFAGLKESLCGKTDDDDDLNIIEKMEATTLTARRSRSRATKGKGSSQDEFYYYSGFGPSWGKKRSVQALGNKDNVVTIDEYDEDNEKQNQIKNTDNGKAEDDHEVDENETGCKKRKNSAIARSLQSLL